jgi:hypothetical protein
MLPAFLEIVVPDTALLVTNRWANRNGTLLGAPPFAHEDAEQFVCQVALSYSDRQISLLGAWKTFDPISAVCSFQILK